MSITAAQMRYLLVIYQLGRNGGVRSSDVADHLDVSRPSAHRMIEQLLKMNLLMKERYSLIRLTESSKVMAEQYYKGFLCISRFLHESLSLSPDTAEEGALSILGGLELSRLEMICARLEEKAG